MTNVDWEVVAVALAAGDRVSETGEGR
jgi:hypothetical protein